MFSICIRKYLFLDDVVNIPKLLAKGFFAVAITFQLDPEGDWFPSLTPLYSEGEERVRHDSMLSLAIGIDKGRAFETKIMVQVSNEYRRITAEEGSNRWELGGRQQKLIQLQWVNEPFTRKPIPIRRFS